MKKIKIDGIDAVYKAKKKIKTGDKTLRIASVYLYQNVQNENDRKIVKRYQKDSEKKVLRDLKENFHETIISQESGHVGTQIKGITAMTYHGDNIFTQLSEPDCNISEVEFCQMAMGMIQQVDDLHQGRMSRSKTCYIHKDIKLDNFVGSIKNPKLIDFGNAESIGGPLESKKNNNGFGPNYPGNWKHDTNKETKIISVGDDIYALGQVLENAKEKSKNINPKFANAIINGMKENFEKYTNGQPPKYEGPSLDYFYQQFHKIFQEKMVASQNSSVFKKNENDNDVDDKDDYLLAVNNNSSKNNKSPRKVVNTLSYRNPHKEKKHNKKEDTEIAKILFNAAVDAIITYRDTRGIGTMPRAHLMHTRLNFLFSNPKSSIGNAYQLAKISWNDSPVIKEVNSKSPTKFIKKNQEANNQSRKKPGYLPIKECKTLEDLCKELISRLKDPRGNENAGSGLWKESFKHNLAMTIAKTLCDNEIVNKNFSTSKNIIDLVIEKLTDLGGIDNPQQQNNKERIELQIENP